MKELDLTNQKFGRLTVLEKAYSKNNKTYWRCLCECGKETIKMGHAIKSGHTLSCGCLHTEQLVNRSRTHGMGKTKINYVWLEMKARCNNPKHKRYKDYGARGISYQDTWEHFEAFYNDMKEGYAEGLTLDRIDNNKGYSRDNCRWVSTLTQNNNKRNNVYETICGITATRSELCDMFKIPRCTFYWRINHGYSIEEALGLKTK